jgi:hypothetical protein
MRSLWVPEIAAGESGPICRTNVQLVTDTRTFVQVFRLSAQRFLVQMFKI